MDHFITKSERDLIVERLSVISKELDKIRDKQNIYFNDKIQMVREQINILCLSVQLETVITDYMIAEERKKERVQRIQELKRKENK